MLRLLEVLGLEDDGGVLASSEHELNVSLMLMSHQIRVELIRKSPLDETILGEILNGRCYINIAK